MGPGSLVLLGVFHQVIENRDGRDHSATGKTEQKYHQGSCIEHCRSLKNPRKRPIVFHQILDRTAASNQNWLVADLTGSRILTRLCGYLNRFARLPSADGRAQCRNSTDFSIVGLLLDVYKGVNESRTLLGCMFCSISNSACRKRRMELHVLRFLRQLERYIIAASRDAISGLVGLSE